LPTIKIANKNKGERGEYVGRGSPLGNPYKLKYDCGIERDKAIEQYRTWLYRKIEQNDPEVLDEMLRLYEIYQKGDLVLLCFCVPKRCHAEVIKDVLISWMEESLEKERS